MRLGLDATPLLGRPSGVGRYVAGLLSGLTELGDRPDTVLLYQSLRGGRANVPGWAHQARLRVPARLLHRLWARGSRPPVELLTGRLDVFHATNFVLPPLRSAAGVVTVHDLTYLRYPETVTPAVAEYRELVPSALGRAGAVVVVSNAVREELLAEYPATAAASVVVAPNGVSPEWYLAQPVDPARRAQLGLPPRYLLFTGNQEPRKNLGLLVRAHAAARREDGEVPPLVLAGPAGWGDRWGGSAPDPRDVVLAGYLDDDDLRAVVAGAVAVLMPSRYEGFGLPVLEAMAAGRPVLASDIASHREIAAPSVRLVDPTDADAWAAAIIALSNTQPGAVALADARTHARGWTWERSAEAHLHAYSTALG